MRYSLSPHERRLTEKMRINRMVIQSSWVSLMRRGRSCLTTNTIPDSEEAASERGFYFLIASKTAL